MYENFVFGTFTGTGAIMTIELGFVPDYFEIVNTSDAGSLWPMLKWFRGFTAAYALKLVVTTYSKITSGGITAFAGEAPGKALTGTFAVALGGVAITGTSTLFLTELKVGDIVCIDGMDVEILAIASATACTIKLPAEAAKTGKVGIRKTGRAPGVLVGADADLNVSGEAGYYMAFRKK